MLLRTIIAFVSLQQILLANGMSPCPNQCNGHGNCIVPDRTCDCFAEFEGPDCSLIKCPVGAAWTDLAIGQDMAHQPAPCSNMGLCDSSTGLCQCKVGFEGKACERTSCPSLCNARGRCMAMADYALTKDIGVDGNVYVYNTVWDAQKIYGCVCDDSWYAPDCSLEKCPTGDDPMTGTSNIGFLNPVQYNEIQRATCFADGGYFTLTFRGVRLYPVTRFISFSR